MWINLLLYFYEYEFEAHDWKYLSILALTHHLWQYVHPCSELWTLNSWAVNFNSSNHIVYFCVKQVHWHSNVQNYLYESKLTVTVAYFRQQFYTLWSAKRLRTTANTGVFVLIPLECSHTWSVLALESYCLEISYGTYSNSPNKAKPLSTVGSTKIIWIVILLPHCRCSHFPAVQGNIFFFLMEG